MKRKLTFEEPHKERNKICVCGKVCFSKKEAGFKLKFLTRLGTEDYLRIYECNVSKPTWHLTRVKERNWNYRRENR